MSKKNLLAKRVLTALALGSMLYAPVAMAKDVNVADNETITGTIYGGDTSSSNILNVNLLGKNSVVYQIVGGFNDDGGNANGNKVTISGSGTVKNGDGKDNGYSAASGDSADGVANNNTLTIHGCNFESDIFGAAGTSVQGNKVVIDGGSFIDRIVGAYTDGNASGNIVSISAGTFNIHNNGENLNDIIGADEMEGTGTQSVFSGNGVEISGGNFVVAEDKSVNVIGANAGQGTLNSNYVKITGGTFTNNGGELNIYGAKTQNGVVAGNSVSVSNVTISADIYGGYADNGTVTGNSVSIVNSTIKNGAEIYGGYVDGDGVGEEKNNHVSLDGVTFVGDGTGNDETRIYGGRHEGGSGNSLHIGVGGFKVSEKTNVTIKRFDAMTFADGAKVTNDGDLTFEKNGDGEELEDIVWKAKITGTGKTYFEPDSAGGENSDSDFTLGNELSTSGGIVVAEGAKLRVLDAGYLGANVTNQGSVNLYDGTLKKVIINNTEGKDGKVKIKGDVALTSGGNIVGGTLQIKDGGHLLLNNGTNDTLVVGTLEAFDGNGDNDNYDATDNKISFDAGKTVVDQISATTYKGTITLGSVGLKDEFDGNVGAVVGTYQLFTGSQDYSQLKINGSAEAVMGAYKYVFSDNGTNDGKLKITKDYGYSLQAIIQDSEPEHKAGKVSSYSLNGDKTMDADMGTLTRVDSSKAREFTINGNGNKLLGNGKNGITVNSGDTLTYKDIAEVSGFNGAAVTNNGTFNANNVTFKNEIAGSGTTNVYGVVNADAKVSNKMNIAGSGTLNIAGANVANTVANAGTFNFLGGNLNYAVTGGGTTNVKENATFNAKVSNSIAIDEGKKLTTDANYMDGSVTAYGTLELSGNGTISHELGGKGALTVLNGAAVTFNADVDVNSMTNKGIMNITADHLKDNLQNDGTLNLGAGTVTDAIGGSGKTYVKGAVVANAAINQEILIDSGSLTFADASNVGGAVTLAANTFLALNGNTLGQNVSGQGEVRIGGEVTASANNLDVVVDNSGVFNVTGGTFKKEVKGTGTLNVQSAVTANASVTAGTISVADGKALTANGNLNVGTISLTNANLTVAEGKTLTVTTALNMTGANTKVTLDKGNVLDDKLAVKGNLGSIIVGTAGELALRFNGAEYTATQHKTAKEALFGDGTTEKAVLTFAGGVLTIDEENETLGVKGEKEGNVVTMSGAQPTVYDKSGEEVEAVGGQAERTVGILNSTGGLESADKVSLEGSSNVTAKDLQIKEVATEEAFAIEVKDGSKLNLTGGDNGLVKDENGQPVKLDLKAETGATINLGNEEKQINNGKAEVNELEVIGTVNVQNIDLNIGTLNVNGGKVVFDPSYHKIETLKFDSGTVQVVNDGTVINVGMDVNDLKTALDSAGLATTPSNDGYIVGNGHGVLALGQQVDLTGGSKYLVVDAKGADVTKALQLGAGAVLVAQKAEETADTPVVKLDKKDDASIADTAQLVISADKYQEDGGDFISYIVLDKEADSLWAEGNVYAADPTYKFTLVDGKLVADWNKVEGIFGEGAIAAPEMYNRILQKEQNTDANKFLKDVINKNASAGSTAATKAAGAVALNAVTSLGELAAVNHGLYTVSNQMTDAVANHMSLIDNEEASRDIWAAYIHNKEDVEEMKLGGVAADYSAKYNGVVVGADLAKSDKGNVGVALSYVDGDISGATAGVRTRNDAEYYGASLYGRVDGKAVSLLGDISYMHGKGDIAQTVMGQEITADAKSDAISVGVRLEKAFKLGKAGRLMPYIGARYMSINTKDYHNSLGMNYDTDKQNLFMAPVGIAYSAHIEDNGWTYKPTFEAGYVFNMGDKNVDQKVSYNGYGDTFGMDIVDDGYWFGRVGFAAEKKHMAYSLGYQYMKSNNAKNSKYMVNVTWKF